MQAIDNFKVDNDLVQKFIKEYTVQIRYGKTIALCWIPSDVGIRGNEKADSAAKAGLSLSITAVKLPATEFMPRVTKLISDRWQECWSKCVDNKLHAVLPTIGRYQCLKSLNRHDSVKINRLRIGHTRLTHSYLLLGGDQPECDYCKCLLTVQHILIDCVALTNVRSKYFTASSLRELFDNVAARSIIDFIKETNLYHIV